MTVRMNALICLGSTLLAIGCTQQVENADSSATVPSDNAEAEALKVVFEASYSETGLFRVYRDNAGYITMSVTGKIGKDDSKSVLKLLDHSLVKTYLKLRPDVARAPDALLALDRERGPVLSRPALTLPPQALPSGADDQTGFLANACVQLCDNGDVLVPKACPFTPNGRMVTVDRTDPEQGIFPPYGDWSGFWNESTYILRHRLAWGNIPNYPAYPESWGFHDWAPNITAGSPYLDVSTTVNVGAMGVTSHWRYPGPC